MKVEVKKVDDIKREMNFEIPKDRVKKKLEEVYQTIGKTAKIKGFRPGKAPRHVLESHHGKLAEEETIQKLIPEVYQEGIEQEKLAPLDLPEIVNVSYKEGIITFTAKLDIRPDIKLKNYKGIKIKRKSSEVSSEEIDKTLEFIKKGQGGDKEITVDDAFARGLGYPNLEEFKTTVKRQMEIDKDRQNRIDLENQIAEDLLKQVKFKIPESLIDKQLVRRVEDAKNHYKSHGMPEEEIQKKEADLGRELRPQVERDIKLYLILDKIAQLEEIQAPQNENLITKVMEFLLKEANWEAK